MMNNILEKKITPPNGTKHAKKLSEIIHPDDYYEKFLDEEETILLSRHLKKSGAFKIAQFLNATFSSPEIIQSPEKWNNYNYVIGVTVTFPTTGEIYFDIGESSEEVSNPLFKFTSAFERARKRAILSSNTVGLHELSSDEEKTTLLKEKGKLKQAYLENNNLENNNSSNNKTNESFKVIPFEEFNTKDFYLPKEYEEGAETVFDLLKIDKSLLTKLKNDYPHNQKYQLIVKNLAYMQKIDDNHGTNLLSDFANKFKAALIQVNEFPNLHFGFEEIELREKKKKISPKFKKSEEFNDVLEILINN